MELNIHLLPSVGSVCYSIISDNCTFCFSYARFKSAAREKFGCKKAAALCFVSIFVTERLPKDPAVLVFGQIKVDLAAGK